MQSNKPEVILMFKETLEEREDVFKTEKQAPGGLLVQYSKKSWQGPLGTKLLKRDEDAIPFCTILHNPKREPISINLDISSFGAGLRITDSYHLNHWLRFLIPCIPISMGDTINGRYEHYFDCGVMTITDGTFNEGRAGTNLYFLFRDA